MSLLPPHEHYVEPFAGGLSVLLAKQPSRMETVSDLDAELMTFWRALRDRPTELIRACALTPHSRAELAATWDPTNDELELARRIWCRLAQGRSGTLRNTGWRTTSTRPARSRRCPATSRPTSTVSLPRRNASTPCRSRTCPPST
ncbi:DNA adenine methylase [Streptomyces kebangsaanensis]|uniref:DNA adenine methylase n=1 Tax=Streptomyces kebangsaanensis TaxID=864058 RepID=UPI001F467C56|nr:DNA adenine methylase [Streptomyces kebangsaanensis]